MKKRQIEKLNNDIIETLKFKNEFNGLIPACDKHLDSIAALYDIKRKKSKFLFFSFKESDKKFRKRIIDFVCFREIQLNSYKKGLYIQMKGRIKRK